MDLPALYAECAPQVHPKTWTRSCRLKAMDVY